MNPRKQKKIKIYIYYNLTRNMLDSAIFAYLIKTKRRPKISMAGLKITIFRSVAQSSASSSSFVFLGLSAGLKVDRPRERSQTRWGPVFQITPRAKKKCSWNDVRLCHVFAVWWRGLACYRSIETNRIIRNNFNIFNIFTISLY